MAISTVYDHVDRAISFVNKTNLFLGIGKQTPWVDEDVPQVPSINTLTIVEPLGFIKVELQQLVVPDESGTIEYRDGNWKAVSEEDAFTLNSKWVYVSAYLKYAEFPLGSYRQIGLFSGLQRAEGVDVGQVILLPSEVADTGILHIIDNRKVTTRQEEQKEHINFILEF